LDAELLRANPPGRTAAVLLALIEERERP